MSCHGCQEVLRVDVLPDPCAHGLCVGQQAQMDSGTLYELVYDDASPCGRSWVALTGGGGGASTIVVEEEGIPTGPPRGTINFIGPGVTAVDNVPSNRVDITISAAVVTNTPPTTIQPDDVAAPGVSLEAARADHRHGIVTDVAGTIAVGDAAAEGVSTSFSRADHRHALPAPAAPANVDHAAAAAGVATTVARADHKHDVNVGVPVSTGTANVLGVATTLSLSDHVHRTLVEVEQSGALIGARPTLNFTGAVTVADNGVDDRLDITITAATVTNVAPVNVDHTAAAVGVSTEAARADHHHDVNFGTPVATGTANATGAATTLALSDHVHRTLVAVQNGGAAVASRPTLNFIGAASVVDNGGSDRVDITVTNTTWRMFTGRLTFLGGAKTAYLCDDWNETSDSPLEYPIPVASHIVLMYCRMRENIANVVTHINLLLNGVQQAQVNYNATVTGNSSTGAISIACAVGDYIDIQIVSGGSFGDDVRIGVTLNITIP